jgi:hypothetical protein
MGHGGKKIRFRQIGLFRVLFSLQYLGQIVKQGEGTFKDSLSVKHGGEVNLVMQGYPIPHINNLFNDRRTMLGNPLYERRR